MNEERPPLYFLFFVGSIIGLIGSVVVPNLQWQWENYQDSLQPHQCCVAFDTQSFENSNGSTTPGIVIGGDMEDDHFEDSQDSPQTSVQRDDYLPPPPIRTEGIYGIPGL
jgi:hypothetical protein